jgi:inorganic pyrophosphatase
MRLARYLADHGRVVFVVTHDLSPQIMALIDRLVHYFASYKTMPGEENKVAIRGTYSVTHAWQVVRASMEDYAELIATRT